MSPEFWLNLQSHYDLEQAQERLKGPDGRERDKSGQIREKRGDTRVATLRKEYGDLQCARLARRGRSASATRLRSS